MRVVFMGSPEFALPTLRALIEGDDVDLAGVVTQPDRPAGRGRALRPPPAKDLAQQHGLPVLQPPRVNTPEALTAIAALAPEVIVIAAYGQILKQDLLDIPTRGVLNVHASLLPKYRGASPVAAAIMMGEVEAGVSIIEVVLALDAGPVIAQRSMPIDDDDTTGVLTDKLASLGAGALVEALPGWANGDLVAQPQDDALSTYAPLITRADAVIDWTALAVDVWRRVRAYNPWPVATTMLDGESLRILEGWPIDTGATGDPGSVVALPDGADAPEGAAFAVQCGSGQLAIVRAQRSGKRDVSGAELLRGMRGLIGKRLGE